MSKIIDMLERKARIHQAEVKANRKLLVKELGEPTSNFFRVSHLTIRHQEFKSLSLKAKTLFLFLCSYRNRYQANKVYFTRSLRQIHKDTGMAIDTIRSARDELIDKRFILAINKPAGRTRYQILDVRNAKTLVS